VAGEERRSRPIRGFVELNHVTKNIFLFPPLRNRNPLRSTKMGKVHGSLARAGKVKSQTPKVEKLEKKKKKTGRARKRDLYTRRFVNMTLFGGKRRMNPAPQK